MAVSSLVYPEYIKAATMGTITWKNSGGTAMEMCLVLDSYVPDEAHNARDDLAEASGGSYVPVSITPSDPAISVSTNLVKFDVDDGTVTFDSPTASQVIGGCAIHTDGGGASSGDLLVCLCDFTLGNVVSDGTTDIVVTPSADGVFKATWVSF